MNLQGGKLSVNNIKLMLKASYKNTPDFINGFYLDKSLSSNFAVVYYNPVLNQAVVVHRGTKESSDWLNNASYLLSRYHKTDRYKEGKRIQELAELKYGANNISTLGHSQGAILARMHGKNTKEIITLNPAYLGEKPLKNEYNIRSSRDIISIGLHNTNRGHDIIIPAKSYNLLNEHKIDILDRLDQNKMIGGYLKIEKIEKSPRYKKKYRVYLNNGEYFDFGSENSSTYLNHHDKIKKQNYIKRHLANKIERHRINNLIPSPSLFSLFLLWNKPTLDESIKDLNKRFKEIN